MFSQTEFQPYGFLLNPKPRRSTPGADVLCLSGGSSLESPGFGTPVQQPSIDRIESPPTPTSLEPNLQHAIATSEHGRHLSDKIDFIVPPMELEPYVDGDVTSHRTRCLFAGQLRFETTPAELRYLLQRLAGVLAPKIEARGPGCFVVYVSNEHDECLVRALNRRLLFDHNGVWFARTAEATDVLIDYVEHVLPTLRGSRRRTLRLPRDCIVIEESRTKKNMQQLSARPGNRTSSFSSQSSPPYVYAPPQYNGCYSPSSEPATPYVHSPAAGFHGAAPPEYVFGDAYGQAPPPYRANMWH